MEIKTLVAKAHENAVKHGFWEPTLPFWNGDRTDSQ